MRLLLFLLLVVAVFPCVAPAAEAADVWLVRSAEGQILDARQSSRLVNPASVLKIATSWWALERLGFEHRFETRFVLDGTIEAQEYTLRGDLVVLGGGDPDFHGENVWRVAERLRALGVREVSGDLLVTRTFYIGWEGGAPYEPDPSRRAGTMARRLLDLLDPDRWSPGTRKSMREFATRTGRDLDRFPAVRIKGQPGVRLQATEPTAGTTIVHRSNPLPVLLKRFTSYSNNDLDRLGVTLGTPEELAEFLRRKLQLPADQVRVSSLSGLGVNRLSCAAMVALVDGFSEFIEAHGLSLADLLPANRCDPGTLENFPGFESVPEATIIAKTGTLIRTDDGVSLIVGQLRNEDGTRTFCRAALSSGQRTREARRAAEQWLLTSVSSGPMLTAVCGAPVVHSDALVELRQEQLHP